MSDIEMLAYWSKVEELKKELLLVLAVLVVVLIVVVVVVVVDLVVVVRVVVVGLVLVTWVVVVVLVVVVRVVVALGGLVATVVLRYADAADEVELNLELELGYEAVRESLPVSIPVGVALMEVAPLEMLESELAGGIEELEKADEDTSAGEDEELEAGDRIDEGIALEVPVVPEVKGASREDRIAVLVIAVSLELGDVNMEAKMLEDTVGLETDFDMIDVRASTLLDSETGHCLRNHSASTSMSC